MCNHFSAEGQEMKKTDTAALHQHSQNSSLTERLFLVFNISYGWFGIDALKVKEIIKVPKITKMPHQPDGVRGLIRLRDKVIPLIDTRHQLSIKTIENERAELIQLLRDREEDHNRFIEELIRCAQAGESFKLNIDPRACKFGKWYYSFKTDNIVLSDYLTKFEAPHNELHKLAARFNELLSQNKSDEAASLVNNEQEKRLAELKKLFAELIEKIRNDSREFAILYERENDTVAFSVDKVYHIMKIHNDSIKPLPAQSRSDLADGVFEAEDKMCLILNDNILSQGVGDLSALMRYSQEVV